MRPSREGDSISQDSVSTCNRAERTSGRTKSLNRAGFESLLSDLTTTFIKLTPAEIDAEIERGLQRICKFMRADRCSLAEFVEQEELFRVTHSGVLLRSAMGPALLRDSAVPIDCWRDTGRKSCSLRL